MIQGLFRALFTAGLAAMSAIPSFTQDTLMVYGTVKDYLNGEPLTSFTMHAYDVDDPAHVLHGQVRSKGRYELAITEERTYRIVYAAEGYIRKQVQVAVKGPTAEEWVGGFGMQVDISLLPERPGYAEVLDGSVFGRAHYDAAAGVFVWDIAYSEAIREQQRETMRAYDRDVGRTGRDR